jgi:ketosteroid isomerase-like protein
MEAIRAITDRVVQAMNSSDKAALFEVLGADAVYFPPTDAPKTGSELRDWLSQFLDGFTIHFDRYIDEEIVPAGDRVLNHYSYEWTVTPKAGGDPMVGCGHGLRIFRLQADGSWKITHEMWSGYRPQRQN